MSELKKLLHIARPHTGPLLLGLFLSLITTLSNIALLAVSGWFIAAMAIAGQHGAQINYFLPAGIIRTLALMRTAGRYAERLVTHNTTFLLLSELRISLFRRFSENPPVMAKSADLLARLQDDVELLDKFYLGVLLPVCIALISVPLILLVMAQYSADIALLCTAGLLLVGIGIPILLARSLDKLGDKEREQASRVRSELLDTLSGMRELAVYNQSERQLARLSATRSAYLSEQDLSHKERARSRSISMLLTQVTLLGAFILLAPLATSGKLPGAESAMLLLFVLASFEAVLMLPDAVIQWPLVRAAARRVFAGGALENAHSPLPQRELNAKPQQPVFELDKVSVRYPGSEHDALSSINMTLEAGEKIAFVGQSGAGKTTLLQLLCGFLAPQQGDIKLMGETLSETDEQTRFSQLGVLSQHSYLFGATVRENMYIAAPEASEAAMWQALERAQIAEHIRALPDGLDTRVGRHGEPLSEGQRRRLCLAQVLLRDNPVLLLDEPGEGLDGDTERRLMDNILAYTQARSLILITHSPALLADMDRVVWIEQGRIRATGTHDELFKHEEDYRDLVTRF